MIKKIIRSKLFIASVVVFFLLIGLVFWQMHARAGFKDAYMSYDVLARIHQNDAYTPGALGNSLRQELNDALTYSLAKETSSSERLHFATHGMQLILDLNTQIDAMGASAVPMQASIDALEAAASDPGNIRQRGIMLEIAVLARAQLKIIEDIRGYSYRANFETGEIFKHIVADKGQLKDTYITELNNRLPNVEEQFNKRENLYSELENNIYRIHQKFDILNGVS